MRRLANAANDPTRSPPDPVDSEQKLRVVELLFFAYRDFTGEPDAALAGYGLGRAHHRVLHFVARHPGLRVADLLEVLKITKQSLARVLKQLVDDGWIEQRPGPNDRRERLLTLTDTGANLAKRLADLQSARIAAALAELGPDGAAAVERFLFAIITPSERASVAKMLADAAQTLADASNASHAAPTPE